LQLIIFSLADKPESMSDIKVNLPPEEKLLLSLCRLDFSDLQKSEVRLLMKEVRDWDRFVRLSNEHGIIVLAWHNITGTGNAGYMPSENLAILQKAYYKSLARTTYLYDRLSGILELARDVDIRVVLLKGMALERTIYRNRGLRQMTDIDILVREDDVLKLRKILMMNGFRSEPFKSPLYRYLIPYLNTHIPRLTKADCHVEIHYKLFDQPDNTLTEKVRELSVPLKLNDHEAFVPPPRLFFLYLISHLSHHRQGGDSQLRQYTDIYLLLCDRYDEIMDDNLISQAREANMERELAVMLYILRNYWDVSFPSWINDFIAGYDHSTEAGKFSRFISRPKDNPDKQVSLKYVKQLKVLPGPGKKALYIAGFFFPSLAFMKKRYRTRTVWGAIANYPVRWVRSVGVLLQNMMKQDTGRRGQ